MRRFDNAEEEKQKNQMNKVNKCDAPKEEKEIFARRRKNMKIGKKMRMRFMDCGEFCREK